MDTLASMNPRPGALRYRRQDGEVIVVNPHDPLYSTASFLATEYWTVDHGWRPIHADNEGADAD